METQWIITEINVKEKTLVVFQDYMSYGLHCEFKSDEEIRDYIDTCPDDAFYDAVFKRKDNPYFLNITSVALPYFDDKRFLDRQLEMYMPIIQKFITDARTDTLKVLYDEETNPQSWMRLTRY